MNVVILLFVLGLVFLFCEIFAPGAVFGIIGGLTLVAGIAVAGSEFGARGGLIAGVVALVAVFGTLYAELVWLPKTRFAQRFGSQARGQVLTLSLQPPRYTNEPQTV